MKLRMREILIITLFLVTLLPITILLFFNLHILYMDELDEKTEALQRNANDLYVEYRKIESDLTLSMSKFSLLLKGINYNITETERENLINLKKSSELDIIIIVSKDGKVIARANSDHYGDNFFMPRLIKEVSKGKTISSIAVLDDKLLKNEGQEIIKKTSLSIKSFKNPYDSKFTDHGKGIFIYSASPIYSTTAKKKEIIAVIFIAQLLDKNFLNAIRTSQWSEDTNVELLPPDMPVKKQFNIAIVPLKDFTGTVIANLVVWFDPQKINPFFSKAQKSYLFISLLTALIVIIASIFIAKILLIPLEELNKTTQEVIKGNYDVQVNVKGPLEIENLANVFNQMIHSLEEKRRMQKDFIATLTHDMRVPLYAEQKVLTIIQNEEKYQDYKNQKRLIDQLLLSNEGLLNLVNTLLDTYKLEEGKYKLDLAQENITEIITSSINELTPLANDKMITVNFDYEDENILLNIDKDEIKRVLNNLLSNSIKFTHKEGKIEIKLYTEDDNIKFYIKDNGKGMTPEEVANLFSRYSSNAKKLKQIGTGLGLYLSYCIVLAHNGKIYVESEVNQGSTFYVSLPKNLEDHKDDKD